MPGSGDVSQVFQATATLATGQQVYNDAWVTLKSKDCIGCPPSGGATLSSSGPTALTSGIPTYDIEVRSADGRLLSRVQVVESTGTISVLSWQQY